ncbi:hypothetical protein [Elizabethkingia meningoseptica]|uniref:hypothetical protein n=1 Tax=Elizabethkingia meningoseptica TaxID=238 RepID=UPI003892258F
MKKSLFNASLWGILTLSLLSSCRTEDNLNQQNQLAEKRFNVFVPTATSGKIDYANGFAYLMKRSDELHKSNMSGINNKTIISTLASTGKNTSAFQDTEPYVEFNIRSEMTTEKNGDKWLVFPKVQGNKVIALVLAYLSKQETRVNYYTYGEQHAWFKENVLVYQNALSKLQKRNILSLSASIKPMADNGVPCPPNTVPDPTGGCMRIGDIDGVTITVPGPADSGLTGPDGGPPPSNGGGSGGYGCEYYNSCYPTPPVPPKPPQEDQCSKAKAASEKATNDYKDQAVQSAKAANQNAYNNDPADAKKEHVTMIENNNGQLSQGKTFNGGAGNVTGEATSNTVGDIHNHNDDLPPSPGDVYSLMEMADYYQNYRTKFVYTQQGTEYALVVTDIEALRNFLRMYPPERKSDNNRVYTNFPGALKIQWQDISTNDGYSQVTKETSETAIAYILDQYNAGVAVTKKNNNGDFKKIGAIKNASGSGFSQSNCNN